VLLAFDTATALVTVALHDGDRVVVEHSSEQPMKHGEHLAPLIARALEDAGMCSLDAVALEAVGTGAATGSFLVATDARRKEVYLASYDADGARLEGPVVTRPADVATTAEVAGAGPGLYPEAFPHAIAPDRPSAGWMAHGVSAELVELLDPEPLYLRRPDAVAGAPRKPVS